jgi:hypothetical protein
LLQTSRPVLIEFVADPAKALLVLANR